MVSVSLATRDCIWCAGVSSYRSFLFNFTKELPRRLTLKWGVCDLVVFSHVGSAPMSWRIRQQKGETAICMDFLMRGLNLQRISCVRLGSGWGFLFYVVFVGKIK